MVSIEDFPTDKGPVWILGKKYDMKRQRHEAKVDVVSRLWMTYRRGFANIGWYFINILLKAVDIIGNYSK